MTQQPIQPDSQREGEKLTSRPAEKRYRFTRHHRLHGKRAFAAVFEQRCSCRAGPLIVYGKRNALAHSRLGLSVSRRVGISVKRHAIKRRLREAFRLSQPHWPAALDLVIVVKTHDTASLEQYQRWLSKAIESLDRRLGPS